MIRKVIEWAFYSLHPEWKTLKTDQEIERSSLIKQHQAEISKYRKQLIFWVKLMDGRCPPEYLHDLQLSKDFLK